MMNFILRKSGREKRLEVIDGELRGRPSLVEHYEEEGLGEWEREEIVAHFDAPQALLPYEIQENDVIGWFPDPDWEPENPEYHDEIPEQFWDDIPDNGQLTPELKEQIEEAKSAEKMAAKAVEQLGGGSGNLRSRSTK